MGNHEFFRHNEASKCVNIKKNTKERKILAQYMEKWIWIDIKKKDLFKLNYHDSNRYKNMLQTKTKDGEQGSRDGEQGWRSGESTRLPPMWPGFDSRLRCHMWVEFVVGSRPCSEGFSPGSPVFLPP